MHTFEGSSGTVFNYNSDFSGPVVIKSGFKLEQEITVPASDILAFVAEFVRNHRIDRIERMTVEGLLE